MNAPHAFQDPRALTHNAIPKYIHRTLLYDDMFPANVLGYLKKFQELHQDFIHILWRREDVLRLMSKKEQDVYNAYSKNVQRADFARYIILREYGGIYVDFDIDIRVPIHSLYEKVATKDCAFFVEGQVSDAHIEFSKWFNYREKRPESRLRVGQAVMFAKPRSKVLTAMVEVCLQRAHLKILNDDDILYTTGPDVARTVVEKYANQKDNDVMVFDLVTANAHFLHVGTGHWRA